MDSVFTGQVHTGEELSGTPRTHFLGLLLGLLFQHGHLAFLRAIGGWKGSMARDHVVGKADQEFRLLAKPSPNIQVLLGSEAGRRRLKPRLSFKSFFSSLL